jgi:hypothetical protein
MRPRLRVGIGESKERTERSVFSHLIWFPGMVDCLAILPASKAAIALGLVVEEVSR